MKWETIKRNDRQLNNHKAPIDNVETLPDIEAIIENCRESQTPFFNGYAVTHEIKEGYLVTGRHSYYDVDKINYLENALGSIKFIVPEKYSPSLYIGMKMRIQEGSKLVGYATITKIFNKELAISD